MNIALYISYPLNGLLMIGLAVGLGIWLNHHFQVVWRWWWLGALTFILSQIGHLPFNWGLTQVFTRGWLPAPPEAWQLPFNALVLGLSAGLWEEWARYVAFRWYARAARTTKGSLMLGAGHGGIEAIILGAIVLGFYIQMVILRSIDISTAVAPEQIQTTQHLLDTYWSTNWYLTLLGALERAFTLSLHVSASLLVYQVFLRNNWVWLAAAIGWHALADGLAVYINGTWGALAAEGFLAVVAMISLVIIWRLYHWDNQPQAESQSSDTDQVPTASSLHPVADDQSDLDSSRYQA